MDKRILISFLSILLLPAEAVAQEIINDWSRAGTGGIVTSVDQGAITEDDFAAQGIINDWGQMLLDFEKSAIEISALDEKIKTIKKEAAIAPSDSLDVIVGPDGKVYQIPRMLEPDGTDMFLLTEEGMTIYMAFDAPVYLQEIDEDVLKWIRFYAYTKKEYTRKLFKRYAVWEPRIKTYFKEQEIPTELSEICLIESGCTYNAKSPVGALGMWQIMPETGRSYGMKIDWERDDRLDPGLSLLVAAKVLKSNYKKLGEWTLAAAAYNCGTGRIKEGYPWSEVKTRLPKETQQYIPALIAIHYIWTYRDKLGFES